MPKEKPVRLTQRAKKCLVDIGVYSAENWGVRKRDAYVDGLIQTILLIGRFPLIGKISLDIKKNLRAITYESHIIHYRIYKKHIGIIDILHKNMNRH